MFWPKFFPLNPNIVFGFNAIIPRYLGTLIKQLLILRRLRYSLEKELALMFVFPFKEYPKLWCLRIKSCYKLVDVHTIRCSIRIFELLWIVKHRLDPILHDINFAFCLSVIWNWDNETFKPKSYLGKKSFRRGNCFRWSPI